MSQHAFGIDLGTTFSEISYINGENIDIISDNKSKKHIPSRIQFDTKNNSFVVGNFAVLPNKPLIYDSKRMLSQKYNDEKIQKMKTKWPFEIEKSETNEILISVRGSERKYQPYEISGEILTHLIENGNKRFPKDQETNKVVITVPANFGNEQREETLRAAQYAGLNVLSIINEPTAACLAVALKRPDLIGSKYVLIFDFGGGTLDISLMTFQKDDIKVIGTDGDMFLGGRDFDEHFYDFIVNNIIKDEIFQKKKKAIQKLRQEIIEAKVTLSNSTSTTLYFQSCLDQVGKKVKLFGNDLTKIEIEDQEEEDNEEEEDSNTNNGSIEIEIDRDFFEAINADLISRILDPVKRVLEDANVDKKEVETIILVGGSSKMTFVKNKLKEFFGREPFDGLDPCEAVSIGAGILANKLVNNEKISYFSTNVSDICSFSIGTTDFRTGKMDVFIKKGTEIPASKSVEFSTMMYRQEKFYVDILEGENELACDNNCIGEFTIENLPETEQELTFIITFSIDKNGVLSASAQLENSTLSGTTSIELTKKKQISESDERKTIVEILKKKDHLKKILCHNILRFIEVHRSDLIRCDPKADIKFWETNTQNIIDEAESDLETDVDIENLIGGFQKTFAIYFKSNDEPFFLHKS